MQQEVLVEYNTIESSYRLHQPPVFRDFGLGWWNLRDEVGEVQRGGKFGKSQVLGLIVCPRDRGRGAARPEKQSRVVRRRVQVLE